MAKRLQLFQPPNVTNEGSHEITPRIDPFATTRSAGMNGAVPIAAFPQSLAMTQVAISSQFEFKAIMEDTKPAIATGSQVSELDQEIERVLVGGSVP